jgi:6-phosphogluconolactonase/glucosamine-6-phosphate isomerase/deaminase
MLLGCSPAVAEFPDRDQLVTATYSREAFAARFVLTLGVIGGASVIVFLVAGSNKAWMAKILLESRTDADRILPACFRSPTEEGLLLLSNRSTATDLTISKLFGIDRAL